MITSRIRHETEQIKIKAEMMADATGLGAEVLRELEASSKNTSFSVTSQHSKEEKKIISKASSKPTNVTTTRYPKRIPV